MAGVINWSSQAPDDVWNVRKQLWTSGYWPLAVYGPEAKVSAPGKQPASKGWQVRTHGSEPKAVSEPPLENTLNTGVLCDGLRAIDIDIDCHDTAQKVTDLVRAILGGAPIRYRNDSARRLMLFRAAIGEPPKRSISGLRGKVEVLGHGQQFVAFGIHPGGCPYQWNPKDFAAYNRTQLNEVTEERVAEFLKAVAPLVEAPVPLLIGIDGTPIEEPRKQNAAHVATVHERAYAAKALKNNADELSNKLPGSGRNAALNGVAFRMGGMVGAGWIERSDVERALIEASKQNGYEAKDGIDAVIRTIQSGLVKGMESPHPSLPQPEILECVTKFAEQGQAWIESLSKHGSAAIPSINNGLVMRRVADVKAQPVNWLWYPRIAQGKVTLISGDPGLGKSQLTAYLAAKVSTGGTWPNSDGQSPLGTVLMLSCEDEIADTIRPRLEAAGADLKRVHVIEAVQIGEGKLRSFSITEDTAQLEAALRSFSDVRLVIVDPITAYLGKTDTHRTSDVRAALNPLQALAARFGVAVVAVSHLNKAGGGGKSVNAVTGSGAFVAAARASFLVIKDEADEDRRLLIESKNNLGRAPGLSYRIRQIGLADGIVAPFVEFESGTVNTTADEALSAANVPIEGGALREAETFLLMELSSGEVSALEIKQRASDEGISSTTLRRAAKKIGAQKIKSGFRGGWVWRLCEPSKVAKEGEDDQSESMATFRNPWPPSTTD